MLAVIKVSFILKAMHVALFKYLALKSPLTINAYMYYIISTKAIHIRILDLKINQVRGNNPEHDITKHLLKKERKKRL